MVYKWKTGFFKVEADVAGKVFEELDRTVGLTAKTVVDASRDESAPLHKQFEWDDEVAGELYREQQARVMIHNLTIEIEGSTGESLETRAFVSIERNDPTYEDVKVVLANESKRTSLLGTAMKELVAVQNKYATLAELAGVFSEIDKLKEVS